MEKKIEKIITEMVYVGFLILFALNFTGASNTERFAVLIIVEATFVGTQVYCKAKQENKKFYKKGDKRNEKKD